MQGFLIEAWKRHHCLGKYLLQGLGLLILKEGTRDSFVVDGLVGHSGSLPTQHQFKISIGYIEKEIIVLFYSVLIKSMEQPDIGFNIVVFFKLITKAKK